jgi:hypothetical protein
MSSKLPAPFYPWVFAAIMGGAMTAIVTAVLVLWRGGFALLPWLQSWALAWLVATAGDRASGPARAALGGADCRIAGLIGKATSIRKGGHAGAWPSGRG